MSAEVQVRNSRQILKASVLYFGLVFGAGFVLGTIRVLMVVPLLGVRNAELLEEPLMLVIVFITAKWIVRHFATGLTNIEILGIGLIALCLLLFGEVIVALLRQPNRPRDSVSGLVYLLMLIVFALMPWALSTWKIKKQEWNV